MANTEFRNPHTALEAFARAVRNAATREDYERLIDEWSARGFPELRAYRDNHRRRGEVVAQAMKTMRALEGDDRALAEVERDRLPALALAQKKISNESIGRNAGPAEQPEGPLLPALPEPRPDRSLLPAYPRPRPERTPEPADNPVSTDRYDPPFRMVNPLDDYPSVRNDSQGSGTFWSDRKGNDGVRYGHRGIDIEAAPGAPVRAPVGGEITKIGFPYGNEEAEADMRYVEIKTPEGYRVRLFYVDPSAADGRDAVKPGDRIRPGQIIGVMQDRARFSSGMTNHMHMEVWDGPKDRSGRPVDPTVWVRGWQSEMNREQRR